jgi:hypothetical protein
MTSRRKAALRKAQLASAAKRKRNAKRAGTAVGIVALAGTAAFVGSRYGSGKSLAADLKGRKFNMTSMKNAAAARAAANPLVKEKVMKGQAVSPPPVRWQETPSGLKNMKNNDPVKSAPSETKAKQNNQPKKSTPPKPDAAPNNQGGMNQNPQLSNTAAVPSTIQQKDIKKAVQIPPQSAEAGRQNMEDSPKVMRNGKEWKEPLRDVWGDSADFQPWSTDKIISKLPGGRVNKKNMKDVLNQMAKEQKNLGRPLSEAQVEGMRKYYGRIFNVDLSKDKK